MSNLFKIRPGVPDDFNDSLPVMAYPGFHPSRGYPRANGVEIFASYSEPRRMWWQDRVVKVLRDAKHPVGSYWTVVQEDEGLVTERRYVLGDSQAKVKGTTMYLKDPKLVGETLAKLQSAEEEQKAERPPGKLFQGITSDWGHRQFFRADYTGNGVEASPKVYSSLGTFLHAGSYKGSNDRFPLAFYVYWDSGIGWMRAGMAQRHTEEEAWHFLTIPEVLPVPLRRFSVTWKEWHSSEKEEEVDARSPMHAAVQVLRRQRWSTSVSRFNVTWEQEFPYGTRRVDHYCLDHGGILSALDPEEARAPSDWAFAED